MAIMSGGNSALAANSNIIAHDNVLLRLSQNTEFPADGLPKTTFRDQLTDKQGVQRSLDMMEQTLKIVQDYKNQGLTEQQVIDKGLGEQWKSWHWNFITEERWIKKLYYAD